MGGRKTQVLSEHPNLFQHVIRIQYIRHHYYIREDFQTATQKIQVNIQTHKQLCIKIPQGTVGMHDKWK